MSDWKLQNLKIRLFVQAFYLQARPARPLRRVRTLGLLLKKIINTIVKVETFETKIVSFEFLLSTGKSEIFYLLHARGAISRRDLFT